jgi:serine/threonine protein kinase
MGEVYRARDLSLKREVAIKILPAFVSRDSDRLRRFEQEAQAAAALNHPNILAVHQFGSFEGAPYLVSELLVGGTLREALNHGPLAVRKTIDYGVQIAHGLATAHDKGIVHRDLKPENLFVTKEGRVKILDFGLAKLKQEPHFDEGADGAAPTQTKQTEPGVVMGTAGYMSPEQVRGKTVDHRTDVFAFGSILYEMLSGKRAFQRSTSAETMTAILNEDPPGISQVTQTAPAGLQRVVQRCLEKNPEQRFQSAADLAFALEALSDSGSASVLVIDQPSRSRLVWAAGAGVVVALAALLIAWWRIPPAVPVVESITQLTDDREAKGNMVTDGSRIYFNEGPDGSLKVAQVSVAGGSAASVETGFENASLTGVTHDGSALLALVGPINQPEYPLWSIPLPAGEPRRLGDIETQNADIFPDGRIVFSEFIRGTDVKGTDSRTDWFIADKDGLNPHKLVSFPGRVGGALVEPNGERVLLSQEQVGNRRLFDIAADGTGLREIRKLSDDECCFNWTPDEKYLVYQSGNAGRSDIWALPMQTGLFHRPGQPVRLTNGPLPYSIPTPSHDGKQVLVLGTKQRGELVRYDMKSHQFQPFLSGISANDPTFSRDGKWIAYASYPEATLWRSREDGTDRLQLTHPPAHAFFPRISPDGTKVAFESNGELFVIGMEGGQPQRISENGYAASWSPDGNYLFYQHFVPPGGGGMVADLRTGKISAVPSSEGIFPFWLTQDILVAPDERQTHFLTYNLKTQKRTDFAPGYVGDIENWMMSLDGKYLYFTTKGTEPKAMRLRFADQQVEFITNLKDLHRVSYPTLNVEPDGSPVFTRDTGYQEIYALNVRWP